MLTLDNGRNAAIRDLDALIARLESLRSREWMRQTPCSDWTIRELGEHLAWTTHFIGAKISELVAIRTGQSLPKFDDAESATIDSTEEIVVRIIHGRNQVFHALSRLHPDDLETVITPPSDSVSPASTGYRRLAMCVLEFGMHRFDIEDALGVRFAGVDEETVLAVDEIYGRSLASIAARTGATPDTPWSLHIDGDILDHFLTWDGASWSGNRVDGVSVARLRGDDSALALFICGRIMADDRRLALAGDVSIANQFKTFVPGP